MKTDTHTSGEWAITWDACQLSIYGKRNERIAEVFGENNVDALNNACLIAAAPEMLAAVEELLADKYLADPINADRMEKARAAVAKVKGGDA